MPELGQVSIGFDRRFLDTAAIAAISLPSDSLTTGHWPLYLSRRGMRRFHESRIVLQLSGRKQAVILIVTSRKEEHHGLVSRAVDRGRATRRQRGTVLSSQPPNSRKDARALVVAHRAHASACGQGCRSQSGHRPAIRGRVSAGGLGRLAAVESQSPGEPGPRRGGPPIAS